MSADYTDYGDNDIFTIRINGKPSFVKSVNVEKHFKVLFARCAL